MGLLSRTTFLEALNGDLEFAIAGRFWDGTLKLVAGDEVTIIKIRNGVVTDVFEPDPADRNYMVKVREYDLVIEASREEWEKFFAPVPKPFYHDMFAAVTRQDFSWGGDIKMWFAHYGAIRRMFDIARDHQQITTKPVEVVA